MIKFLDLHKINEQYREEIDKRIKNVLTQVGIYLAKRTKILNKILQSIAVQNIVSAAVTV